MTSIHYVNNLSQLGGAETKGQPEYVAVAVNISNPPPETETDQQPATEFTKTDETPKNTKGASSGSAQAPAGSQRQSTQESNSDQQLLALGIPQEEVKDIKDKIKISDDINNQIWKRDLAVVRLKIAGEKLLRSKSDQELLNFGISQEEVEDIKKNIKISDDTNNQIWKRDLAVVRLKIAGEKLLRSRA